MGFNLGTLAMVASTYGRHDPRITTIVLHQAYSYLLFGAEVWATKNDALHADTLKSVYTVAHTAARALDLPTGAAASARRPVSQVSRRLQISCSPSRPSGPPAGATERRAPTRDARW